VEKNNQNSCAKTEEGPLSLSLQIQKSQSNTTPTHSIYKRFGWYLQKGTFTKHTQTSLIGNHQVFWGGGGGGVLISHLNPRGGCGGKKVWKEGSFFIKF